MGCGLQRGDFWEKYGADYRGSPYAINDYRVAEDLGTEDDLIVLVERAHATGLRVIVDFVPNHMGLDSAWLNDHPEFFIHRVLDAQEAVISDSELEQRYPHYFPYRTPSYPENGHRVPKTIMVAYGKDPYFYPWIDTAQLDYAEPALRRKMTDVLTRMAKIVDGVRCDMAMLVLREQVKIHRHPDMSWDTFNRWMPEEFLAGSDPQCQTDEPYFSRLSPKPTGRWKAICSSWASTSRITNHFMKRSAARSIPDMRKELMNLLRLLGSDFLKRSVNFLENHDEERAMNTLGEERQRGAAALLLTLPRHFIDPSGTNGRPARALAGTTRGAAFRRT